MPVFHPRHRAVNGAAWLNSDCYPPSPRPDRPSAPAQTYIKVEGVHSLLVIWLTLASTILRSTGASVLNLPPLRVSLLIPSIYPIHATATTSSYSTMASAESTDDRQGGGKPMLARQRAKEEGDNQQPRSAYFPLGYKEGFSQWWAGLTPAQTEHRVLSFVPHLQKPPTHTQTGSAPVSANTSMMNVDQSEENRARPVRTNSITDPYGPRQWHSKLVQLAG